MPQGLTIGLLLAYSYLVGSIPTAYLVGRWVKGIDIRRYGSGNIGGSNVVAHVGKRYAIPVGLFDILVKGAVPVIVSRDLLDIGTGYQALAGLVAVIGHSWPLYLRFTGGRGVGTSIGVLSVLAWKELLAFLGVAGVGWLLFRATALWCGIAIVLLPLWAWVFGAPGEVRLFSIALGVVLALKRLEANRQKPPEGVPKRILMLRRLLHDRDVSTDEEWTRRKPGKME